MKAIFISLAAIFGGLLTFAQNHSSQDIRMMVEEEHDHIADYDSYTVRVKLFNPQNEILYEADLFNGEDLDEIFFYYNEYADLERERRIFNNEHESGKVEFKYNDNERLIEETEYDHDGNPIIRITMEYDGNGHMTGKKRELRHEKGDELYIESEFTYEYDPAGRPIKQKGFENGKEEQTVTYQYWYEKGGLKHTKEKLDSGGNVTERWIEAFNPDGHKEHYKHTAYEAGKEKILTDISYTYTKYGDVSSETIRKEGRVVKEIEFEYAYDNHGNWTSKKERKGLGENKKEVASIKRWIEYYEKEDYAHPPMELDEQFTVEEKENGNGHKHISAETHVRINNNNEDVVWQVRRNGKDLFQVDYNQYVGKKLIQTKHLNNYKKANYFSNYEYDDNGDKLIAKKSLSFDKKLNERTTFEYNDKGRLIKREEYFPADMSGENFKVEISETFEYDKDGNVHKKTLAEYGEKYDLEYVYDNKNELLAYIMEPYSDDEEKYTERYGYNEAGNMISRDVYEGDSGDPVENDLFEYDENGELLKSSFYEGGELREVTLYEYFE